MDDLERFINVPVGQEVDKDKENAPAMVNNTPVARAGDLFVLNSDLKKRYMNHKGLNNKIQA